jgi:hypothetical protein
LPQEVAINADLPEYEVDAIRFAQRDARRSDGTELRARQFSPLHYYMLQFYY